MRVAYLTNALPTSGVGHYAASIMHAVRETAPDFAATEFMLDGEERTLSENGHEMVRLTMWPWVLQAKSITWVRLGNKWRKATSQQHFDIYHALNQTLSFLVKDRHHSVITVHDIIELLEPQAKAASLLNRYLYSGISRADHLIAISRFTAQTLREYYGVPEDRISVIYNGVGKEFHPIPNFPMTIACQMLRHEFKIPIDKRVILHVGSDHPRKNVITAVRAFATMQHKLPQTVFIKVGTPGIAAGRSTLLEEIDRLGIREHIRFVGSVSGERLNELYNLAAVLLYPSRLEGFGLPPLEAMASGTPVITTNAMSLPEIVGDNRRFGAQAALVRDPDDIDGFAADIVRVLEDGQLAFSLRQRGLERAQRFSWIEAARNVATVYRRLM